MRRLGCLALTTVLLVAGCSSGSKGGTSPTTSVQSGAPTSTASTAPADTSAQDNVAAAMMVLKASDLPTGWESAPHKDTPTDQTVDQQMSQCMHVSRTIFNRGAKSGSADSPDFSMNNNSQQVSNSVTIRKTKADVDQGWAVFDQPDLLSCLQVAFKAALASTETNGVKITDVTVHNLNFSPLLDRTAALRINIGLSSSGLNITAVDDIVLMQRGRVIADLNFVSSISAFDTTLEQQLASTVASRVSATSVS
jgi:hypothetical protein